MHCWYSPAVACTHLGLKRACRTLTSDGETVPVERPRDTDFTRSGGVVWRPSDRDEPTRCRHGGWVRHALETSGPWSVLVWVEAPALETRMELCRLRALRGSRMRVRYSEAEIKGAVRAVRQLRKELGAWPSLAVRTWPFDVDRFAGDTLVDVLDPDQPPAPMIDTAAAAMVLVRTGLRRALGLSRVTLPPDRIVSRSSCRSTSRCVAPVT